MQPALPERLEQLALPDHLALREQPVKPVQLVHKDLLDRLVQPARLALKAQLALLV